MIPLTDSLPHALLLGLLVIPAYFLIIPLVGIGIYLSWEKPKKLFLIPLMYSPFLSFTAPPAVAYILNFSPLHIASSFISGLFVFLILTLINKNTRGSQGKKKTASRSA